MVYKSMHQVIKLSQVGLQNHQFSTDVDLYFGSYSTMFRAFCPLLAFVKKATLWDVTLQDIIDDAMG